MTARKTQPKRRRRKIDDDFLRKVVDIYRGHDGNAPLQEIAERYKVSVSTAAYYVARAREFGFLGSALRGRAGEEITEPLLLPGERIQTVNGWNPVHAHIALSWLVDKHPDVFDAAARHVGRVHGNRACGDTLARALVREVDREQKEAT